MNHATASIRLLFFLVIFLFFALHSFAQADSLPNTLSISYEHTHFDKQFAHDWRLTSLEYKRQTRLGALLGRVNHATRSQRSGWQGELEAYPVVSKKLYAFAGLSYAAGVPPFPQWRAGTTVYYNFAQNWEADGGFRYLYFNNSIWIGTAGISRYLGRWLFNARSFFSVRAPLDNQSYFIKAQRYLKNEHDYLWLQAGNGVSPDESRNIQLSSEGRLRSKRLAAGARLSMGASLQLVMSLSYSRDEYRTKTFGNQYNGAVGLSFRFR